MRRACASVRGCRASSLQAMAFNTRSGENVACSRTRAARYRLQLDSFVSCRTNHSVRFPPLPHCSTIHRPPLLELDVGVADNFAPALGLAADEGTEFLRPASRRLKQHARDALAHVGGRERRDEFLVKSLYDCVGSLGRD